MRPVAGLVLLVVFIAGCATPASRHTVADPVAAWQVRQSDLSRVTAWNLLGRVALRTADQGWHATLKWDREGPRHRFDLTGPLGRGHLRLVQDGQGAELRDADQRVWRDASSEILLHRATGWVVPLDGMNYWVLGLPVPNTDSTQQLDTQGRLGRLEQSGWDIRFVEYARFDAFELPSKLFITRLADRSQPVPANEETIEVRLSVERWTFHQ